MHRHERNIVSARVHQNGILVLYYIRCVTDLAGMHRFAFQHIGVGWALDEALDEVGTTVGGCTSGSHLTSVSS